MRDIGTKISENGKKQCRILLKSSIRCAEANIVLSNESPSRLFISRRGRDKASENKVRLQRKESSFSKSVTRRVEGQLTSR